MRKFLLMLGFLLLAVSPVQSQVMLGFKAGAGSSQFQENSERSLGMKIGLFGDLQMNKYLILSTEANFVSRKGTKQNLLDGFSSHTSRQFYNLEVENNYIEFPFMVKLNVETSRKLSHLPYIGYAYSFNAGAVTNKNFIEGELITDIRTDPKVIYGAEENSSNSIHGIVAGYSIRYEKFVCDLRYFRANREIGAAGRYSRIDSKYSGITITFGYVFKQISGFNR